MTKKHFKSIAEILRVFHDTYAESKHARTIIKLLARRLSDYFQSVNPRFDNDRFLQSCGVTKNRYE